MKNFIKILFPFLSIVIGSVLIDESITRDFNYSSWCGFGGFILVSIGVLRGYYISEKMDEKNDE